uniref:Protein kinase domain-containing protein n=1 Tax=Tetraselmis sp. GSL018 TaxID=582737 RepID=A0A061RF11_9CHLO
MSGTDFARNVEQKILDFSAVCLEECSARESLRLIGWLGKGAFSNVYRAVWGTTETALKVTRASKKKLEDMLAMEVAVGFCSRHPNVVTTYSYSLQKRPIADGAHNMSKALGNDCGGSQTITELSQDAVWEVQILQECCDIGTLQKAIRRGLLRRLGTDPSREEGFQSGIQLAPESAVSLHTEPQPQSHSGSGGHASSSREKAGNSEEMTHRNSSFSGFIETRIKPKSKENTQDMGMVLGMAADIIEGMVYLHNRGVVHGDIKPSNVLLKTSTVNGEQQACAKISDFGTAVLLHGRTEVTGYFAGTPSYMAPEVIAESTVSKASDVYSFGILLFEMATAQRPYPERRSKEIMHGVVHNKLRPQITVDLPRQLIELISSCWADDPCQRPTFKDVGLRIQNIAGELGMGNSLSGIGSGQDLRRVLAERAVLLRPPSTPEAEAAMSGHNPPRKANSTLPVFQSRTAFSAAGNAAGDGADLTHSDRSLVPGTPQTSLTDADAWGADCKETRNSFHGSVEKSKAQGDFGDNEGLVSAEAGSRAEAVIGGSSDHPNIHGEAERLSAGPKPKTPCADPGAPHKCNPQRRRPSEDALARMISRIKKASAKVISGAVKRRSTWYKLSPFKSKEGSSSSRLVQPAQRFSDPNEPLKGDSMASPTVPFRHRVHRTGAPQADSLLDPLRSEDIRQKDADARTQDNGDPCGGPRVPEVDVPCRMPDSTPAGEVPDNPSVDEPLGDTENATPSENGSERPLNGRGGSLSMRGHREESSSQEPGDGPLARCSTCPAALKNMVESRGSADEDSEDGLDDTIILQLKDISGNRQEGA